MKLKELYDTIDAVAPFSLSEEYRARGAHDNSGILVDCGSAENILFSLDLSSAAVEEARRRGADCIVTHHPAIWEGLMSLTGGPVLACARAGISVISAHLNLDSAPCGIDEQLMLGLGGSEPAAVMERLTGGGYGRVYDVPPQTLASFEARARETFRTERTVCYGEGKVTRVASFCGAGLTEEAVCFAAENGADTVVSSDGKHHIVLAAAERGLNLLLLTHYAAENYGFCRFAERIQKIIGKACAVFTDERFL